MDHEEFCDENHSIFEGCNTYAYPDEIGICNCGTYGNLGAIHNRRIDGQMEECGEFL